MNFSGMVILLLLSFNSLAWTQTIQVPDKCINRTSPCLIRTEEDSFMFVISGQKVVLQKEAILRIDSTADTINFELMDGRISIVTQEATKLNISVNNQTLSEGRMLIYRSYGRLDILNLNNYNIRAHKKDPQSSEFYLTKEEFINKEDFIRFTKNYFQSSEMFKTFLVAEASRWKEEFDKQNNDQDKILLRKIASEREKAKIEAEKNAKVAEETKKLRAQFFYRTFKR